MNEITRILWSPGGRKLVNLAVRSAFSLPDRSIQSWGNPQSVAGGLGRMGPVTKGTDAWSVRQPECYSCSSVAMRSDMPNQELKNIDDYEVFLTEKMTPWS